MTDFEREALKELNLLIQGQVYASRLAAAMPDRSCRFLVASLMVVVFGNSRVERVKNGGWLLNGWRSSMSKRLWYSYIDDFDFYRLRPELTCAERIKQCLAN